MWALLESASDSLGRFKTNAEHLMRGMKQSLALPRIFKDYYQHPNLQHSLFKKSAAMFSMAVAGIALSRTLRSLSEDDSPQGSIMAILYSYGLFFNLFGLYMTSQWSRDMQEELIEDKGRVRRVEQRFIDDAVFYAGSEAQLLFHHLPKLFIYIERPLVVIVEKLIDVAYYPMTCILLGMGLHAYSYDEDSNNPEHWDYFLGFGLSNLLMLYYGKMVLETCLERGEVAMAYELLKFFANVYLIHQAHHSDLKAMRGQEQINLDPFYYARRAKNTVAPVLKHQVKRLGIMLEPEVKDEMSDISRQP